MKTSTSIQPLLIKAQIANLNLIKPKANYNSYCKLLFQNQEATFLFVSKDEIDPLVDLTWDELRLEGLPVDPDELVRIGGPGGKLHVAHLGPVLDLAQLEAVHVHEHLGKAEELRD